MIDKSGAVYYQVRVEDQQKDVPPEKAGFFVLTKLLGNNFIDNFTWEWTSLINVQTLTLLVSMLSIGCCRNKQSNTCITEFDIYHFYDE